jgi:hypothetical protein
MRRKDRRRLTAETEASLAGLRRSTDHLIEVTETANQHLDEIAQAMAEYDRLRAQKLTDAQLQANIDTYRLSAVDSANYRWRQTCLAEQAHRTQQTGDTP